MDYCRWICSRRRRENGRVRRLFAWLERRHIRRIIKRDFGGRWYTDCAECFMEKYPEHAERLTLGDQPYPFSGHMCKLKEPSIGGLGIPVAVFADGKWRCVQCGQEGHGGAWGVNHVKACPGVSLHRVIVESASL